MKTDIQSCESLSLSCLERVTGGAGLVPPAGSVPLANGSFGLRFGPQGGPIPGDAAASAAQRGQQLYREGWNVTRPIVPGTGTPGMLDNMFVIRPR